MTLGPDLYQHSQRTKQRRNLTFLSVEFAVEDRFDRHRGSRGAKLGGPRSNATEDEQRHMLSSTLAHILFSTRGQDS